MSVKDQKENHITFHFAISLAVITLLGYLLYRLFSPFLYVFLSAFILTIFIRPLYHYLLQKMPGERSAAAFFSLFIFILVISLPIVLFVTSLISETTDILHTLQNSFWPYNQVLNNVNQYLEQFGVNTIDLNVEIRQNLINYLRIVVINLSSLVSLTAGLIINGLFTLIASFYLLINRDEILKYIYKINPVKKEHLDLLIIRGTEVLMASVRGTFFNIFIHFLAGLSGFIIFQVPSPVILAVLFGAVSLIPGVGIATVWVPVVFYLFLTGNMYAAIGFVIWCLGINLIIDNYISPKIIGDSTRLHPVLVLFSILGGIEAFGIFGIILGPTIVALAILVLELYKDLQTR